MRIISKKMVKCFTRLMAKYVVEKFKLQHWKSRILEILLFKPLKEFCDVITEKRITQVVRRTIKSGQSFHDL